MAEFFYSFFNLTFFPIIFIFILDLEKKKRMSFKAYLNQNYEQLKYDYLRSGVLYRDEYFPAEDKSISILKHKKKDYKVLWKRPFELFENPKFIINGIDPNDLVQGDNGIFLKR